VIDYLTLVEATGAGVDNFSTTAIRAWDFHSVEWLLLATLRCACGRLTATTME
jgi:hypothetical protein